MGSVVSWEDRRESRTRATSEGTWLSLEKWRLEAGWILSRIDGLQYSLYCPEIIWGRTHHGDRSWYETGYLPVQNTEARYLSPFTLLRPVVHSASVKGF